MKFRVGDKVRARVDLDPVKKGDIGTIIGHGGWFPYEVEFAAFRSTYVRDNEIELVSPDYWFVRAMDLEKELSELKRALKTLSEK